MVVPTWRVLVLALAGLVLVLFTGTLALGLAVGILWLAALGVLADHLWQGTRPDRHEVDRITQFCVAAVRA